MHYLTFCLLIVTKMSEEALRHFIHSELTVWVAVHWILVLAPSNILFRHCCHFEPMAM